MISSGELYLWILPSLSKQIMLLVLIFVVNLKYSARPFASALAISCSVSVTWKLTLMKVWCSV